MGSSQSCPECPECPKCEECPEIMETKPESEAEMQTQEQQSTDNGDADNVTENFTVSTNIEFLLLVVFLWYCFTKK